MNVSARIAAAVFCAAVFAACGCASRPPVVMDARHPVLRVSPHGIFYGNERIEPRRAPYLLGRNGIPKDRTIHIKLDPDVRDMRPARELMGHLCREGWRSPVLVTERHAEAAKMAPKPKKTAQPKKAPQPKGKPQKKNSGRR